MRTYNCPVKEDNLPTHQRRALMGLQNRKDLTIKPSDKGGNVVVMDTEHYKTLCLQILNNRNWYKRVPLSRFDDFAREFYDLINDARERGIVNNTV